MSEHIDICIACGHSLGDHVQSVDGKVRCWHVDSGISDSGILGMPWSQRCDCLDYKSEIAEWRKAEEDRQRREDEEHMNELIEAIKIKMKDQT